jgi:hypothetical protein
MKIVDALFMSSLNGRGGIDEQASAENEAACKARSAAPMSHEDAILMPNE